MEKWYMEKEQLALNDIVNSLEITSPYKITGEQITIRANDNALFKIWLNDDSHISGECWSDYIHYSVISSSNANCLESGHISLGDYRMEFYHSKYSGYNVAGRDKSIGSFGSTDLNKLMPNVMEELKTVMNFYGVEIGQKTIAKNMSVESELVYFEADFVDSEPQNGIALQVHIDGFPEDENEEGHTVAKVIQTESGDIATVWQDNGYRMNESVKELIADAIEGIKEGRYKANEAPDYKNYCENLEKHRNKTEHDDR